VVLLLALALPVSLPGQRNPAAAALRDYGGLLPPSGHAALEAKALEVEAARGWKVVPSTYTSAIPQIGGNFGGWLAGQTGTVLFYLPAGFEGGLPYIGVSPDLEYVLPWQFRQRIAAEEMTAPFLQLDHHTALMNGMQALLAPPSSGPFILIGAEKYYHGDVAVFCRTNDTLLLSAHLGETVPFGQAVWEGASPHGSNSAKVPFSFAAEQKQVKVISSEDTVEIEVTIIFDNLYLAKDTSQRFAYDANNIREFFKRKEIIGTGQSLSIDHPAYLTEVSRRFAWKYIPFNEDDLVAAVLRNESMKRGLNFSVEHEQFLVNPQQAETKRQPLTVSNDCPQQTSTMLSAFYDSSIPCDSSSLNIFGSPMLSREVAFVFVKKDTASQILPYAFEENQIRQKLRKIYEEAGVRFPKVSFYNEVVQFDINGNGKLDVFNVPGEYPEEVQAAIDTLKEKEKYESYNGVLLLFLDSLETQGVPRGKMLKNTKYGAIYMQKLTAHPDQPIKTIAHELGHGLFGLHHPWDEFPDYPVSLGGGLDGDNLMDYKPNGISLKRIYQLIHIHQHQH
jgi:hypothetical protein